MQMKPVQYYKLTDNLRHQISLTFNEDVVILDVFLGDRIRIQKSFQNTLEGNNKLLLTREKLNTETKVKKYLNIKE